MKAKDVIESVNRRLSADGISKPRHMLTNSKLNDYRRYLQPTPSKYHGTKLYNYTKHHCDTLIAAIRHIARDDRKTSAAFERAQIEVGDQEQMNLGLR